METSSQKTKLQEELLSSVDEYFDKDMSLKFKNRINIGNLTIQENPENHFCIYFAAYDSNSRELFIGHHKGANKWLFNGCHIDKGETLAETLKREIEEEWGIEFEKFRVTQPSLFTISKIDNPSNKRICKTHYDVWFFVQASKNHFKPSKDNLLEEFYSIKWMKVGEARRLVKNNNTLTAIDFIESNYLSK
ncbi:MAG: NUDIX domain-containing protein [Candidatus Omnitrophica bacterium]|nr:NUDIX domain-containing protein [Candidatus Omnitrophota bacterium]